MLFDAAYASQTGVQGASSFLDAVSNNVANSNTNGYKAAQIRFQDLLYSGPAAGALANGSSAPEGTQSGAGVAVASTTGLFTQGALQPTGKPLDVGVSGQGFFRVTLPGGAVGYTRAGDFTTTAAGQLVTQEGYVVGSGITVPPGASAVSVGADGTVTADTGSGKQVLGQLSLTRFQNPDGLTRVGDTVFTASAQSGPAVTGAPGSDGLGTLQGGALEQSNVELPTELTNLIVAQSAFRSNTQALQVENDTMSDTVAQLFPS